MERLLISSCLLSNCCKYSGGSNGLPNETIEALRRRYRLVPVCPELAGGLSVPRNSSERRGQKVVDNRGNDVSREFEKGAACAAALAERFGCRRALLKANSPSCGVGSIYDGSFSGRLTTGDGLSCERLRKMGLELYTEKQLESLI